jgi:aminopeptidase N
MNMPKVYLKDYKPSDYTISNIYIKLELDETDTIVTSTLFVNKQNMNSSAPLILNGGNFELASILLDNKPLNSMDYSIENNELTLHVVPEKYFQFKIVTKINPKNNRALVGLYEADGLLTTHCEAEGFRNITFYLDRPDVLATFTTEIHADKTKYPILLSNGNLTYFDTYNTNPVKHFAVYHDPIPKPSYLYAMVAGQLALREDHFITRSNKKVTLKIFVPAEDLPKTEHAMQALKAAMLFDEEHYDREYDLEIYNIVGVPQFNMGAMENKGLNIFNNSSLLAHPDMATDDNFERIYSVVGHEYFHNWRGDRVTVDNWFQLSLKEGFATITEQEFSQSLYKSMVPRIGDIDSLMARQFPQDASPLAHPVMPTEYEVTENLYTTTIYLKGAELLNMLKSMLGKEIFKKGCSIYFTEHDGKSASIEDFLSAMEKASNKNLAQFLIWYQQAGTPLLEFEDKYDQETKTYYLTARQTCLPTPGQPDKKALLIPIAVSLLNKKGQNIELQLQDEEKPQGTTRTLELTKAVQTFIFFGVEEKPVPSLLRNFSAPVKIIKSPVSAEELKFLLKHDDDPINRWFAARNIAKQAILTILQDLRTGKSPVLDTDIMTCYRAILLDPTLEPRLTTELLTFPPLESFFEFMNSVDPDLIHHAREFFVNGFIQSCYTELKSTYTAISKIGTSPLYSPESASIRALKNLCLSYLMKSNHPEAVQFCMQQLQRANNMTDTLGALSPLAIYYNKDCVELRQVELDKFSQKWQDDALVIEHLFKLYAESQAPDVLDQIIKITQSPIFKKDNPDHIRSLIRTFSAANPQRFHEPSGKAYQFVADFIIELDKFNPSAAASLVPSLVDWKNFEPIRQRKMLDQLYRIYDEPGISITVKELVAKSIQETLLTRKTLSPTDNDSKGTVIVGIDFNQKNSEENMNQFKNNMRISIFNTDEQNHPKDSNAVQNNMGAVF